MAQRAGVPPTSRRIYLRGLGSQAGRQLGSFVYLSPALRRTKRPTKAQVYSTNTLAVAARFVPLANAWEYQQAKDLAGASGFTWKDMLISGFFGNAVEFTDSNGVLWQGRRILADNIQALLDSLSSTPGSILVRTANGWAALYIGSPSTVLTVDPATNLPNWVAPASGPSGGGGGDGNASVFIDPNAGTTSSTNIFDGLAVILRSGSTIGHLEFYSLTDAPTAKVQAAIYNRSGTVPGTLVASSALTTGVVQGLNKLALTVPLLVSADNVYWIGILNQTSSFSYPQTPASPFWQFVESGALPTTAPAGTAGNAAAHLKCWTRP